MGDTSQGLRRKKRVQSPTVAEISASPDKYRKMSEEAVNNEFAIGVAPYFDYSTSVDSKSARYVGTPGIKEGHRLNLGGYTIPADATDAELSGRRREYQYRDAQGGKVQLPLERGTVNAVGSSATPNIWAHENRHFIGEDGNGETYNRLADAATAQNSGDWKSAIRMWQDKLQRERKDMTRSESERDMLENLQQNGNVTPRGVYKRDYERGARRPDTESLWKRPSANYEQRRVDKSLWKARADELSEFDEWNNGLRGRNRSRTGQDRYGKPRNPAALARQKKLVSGLRSFAETVTPFANGVKNLVTNTGNNYANMYKQAPPDAKLSDANYRNGPKTAMKHRSKK